MESVFGFKVDLGTASGLLDPHGIDPLVKKAVELARRKYRPTGGMRDTLMNYGLALISARLDSAAEKVTEPKKTTMRKMSDFLDGFRADMFGKESLAELEKKTEGTEMSPELRQALAKIDEAWLERADLILEGTDPASLSDAKAILAKEAEARYEIRQITLFGPKKEEPKKKPGVPFKKQVAGVAKSAGNALNAQLVVLNTHLAPMAAEAKARADAEVLRNRLRRTSTAGSQRWVRLAKAALLFPVTALTFPFRRR